MEVQLKPNLENRFLFSLAPDFQYFQTKQNLKSRFLKEFGILVRMVLAKRPNILGCIYFL